MMYTMKSIVMRKVQQLQLLMGTSVIPQAMLYLEKYIFYLFLVEILSSTNISLNYTPLFSSVKIYTLP